MHTRTRDALTIAGLVAAYVVTARLGLAMDAIAGFATLVWPPTGIALAAVLLLGYRVWPGVFIGAAVANILAGAPAAVALGIASGNTLEALAATYLLRRIPRFNTTLESVKSVVGLIAFAAVLSTMISASIGVASLYFGHIISAAQLRHTWRAWWIGDMVGALLIAPLLLVWVTRPRAQIHRHWVEMLSLGVAVVVVSATTFFDGVPRLPALHTPFHQLDLLFAVLTWAALRFGQRGGATAAVCVSATAIAGTIQGYGPFAVPQLHQTLLSLQTFMALVAATVLLLGATLAERLIVHEEAKAARDAATQANLVKSEFVAVMSHELRTPLNAIAGYSELLETGVYGPLTDKQAEVVGRIHQSEKQLLSLVEEVLGFAEAEKGQVVVLTGRVQVIEAFDAVEPQVDAELSRKHFVLKREPVLPRLAVQADAKGLQQILVSLLTNASRFTEEGGSITLGAEPQGKKVCIWVRDTGVGIPEDQIKNVFEPFFQTDHGTTRQTSGIGLGLTIARDLARRMQGDVTITSKVGRGTTASVFLPAA